MSKETLSFQTEVKQLLQLMIHSLYSNREIFLRELISNASDACDKLRFEALTDASLYEGEGELAVKISFDSEANTLTIQDNGIGMNRAEVIDNIGTIAKSGTAQFLSQLSGDQKKDTQLIGQFGVGFYSAFIVADKVTLTSRRAGAAQSEGVRWESDGSGEFSIEPLELATRGTCITLHFREEHVDLLNEWRLRSIIEKYSDHIALPVMLWTQQFEPAEEEGQEPTKTQSFTQVNQAQSIWMRPKKDISESEYQQFYQHVSHDYANPLAWTHSKVEGKHDYTALLYIPEKAPFDLFERDKGHGVKLYVQRVFIMDDAENLMPRYLRFVRGVIDSADLPLNVSREILQSTQTLSALRNGAVKRVLSLLDDLANSEELPQKEKYQTFWNTFGRVLKEGLGEDSSNREQLAKLLRFYSTSYSAETQATVSLADYCTRQEGDKIYYLTAENKVTAEHSPHLEVFRKKGIEVLLMVEPVDEWAMNYLTEFEGKKFVHIAKGDVTFDDTQSNAEEDAQKTEEAQSYIDALSQLLEEKVEGVRLSKRLTDSPACLVRHEQAMSGHFERLLRDAGHDVPSSKPWLEINPDHPLVQQLQHVDQVNDLGWLLHDQAVLAEGGQLVNPAEFVSRMNRLLLKTA